MYGRYNGQTLILKRKFCAHNVMGYSSVSSVYAKQINICVWCKAYDSKKVCMVDIMVKS